MHQPFDLDCGRSLPPHLTTPHLAILGEWPEDRQEQPETARSRRGMAGGAKSGQGPRRAARSHNGIPGAIQSHPNKSETIH